jgi:hypothetical protein
MLALKRDLIMKIDQLTRIDMTIKKYECSRPSSLSEGAIILGFVLFICATFVPLASAQDTNLACRGFEMGPYASVSFCLPSSVPVDAGSVTEGNYSQGRALTLPFTLNGSLAVVSLLYPCATTGELNLSQVQAEVEAFDSERETALYSTTPMNISGRPSLLGMVGSQVFAAYSPSPGTAALLIFGEGMPESTVQTMLASAYILVNRANGPVMYCAPALPALAVPSTTQYLTGYVTDQGPEAEQRLQRIAESQERLLEDTESARERLGESKEGLLEDMESSKERLAETKETLMGFGSISLPSFRF